MVCDLVMGTCHTFVTISLNKLYLFDSNFLGIVWIDKVHNFLKAFVCLTMVTMEIEKGQFFSYHSNGY